MRKHRGLSSILISLTALLAVACNDNVGGATFHGTSSGTTTTQSSSNGSGSSSSTGSGVNDGGSGNHNPNPLPTRGIPNVLTVTVGGTSLCGNSVNQPCTSITLCVPGTQTCQTIDDILVDTGSYGLRIFSQVLTLSLPQVNDGSGKPVAECAQFGTGNDWGPVVRAGVVLGGESQISVPIQLINSGYASIPSSSGCTSPDTSPMQAGFNGILGVGLFAQDCGSACVTQPNVGIYYSCSGTNCSGTTLPLTSQVQNPVTLLPGDNNGIALSLPTVPAGGTTVTTGSLYLGIGTTGNNTPTSVTTYLASKSGNFTTAFNSQTYMSSFIDSGSNGFFFPAPTNLPSCSSNDPYAPGWFCPSSTQSYSATSSSYNGTSSSVTSFQIAKASDLVASGNAVFNNLGADASSSGFGNSFDWGLPFFFGKTVYVGFESKSSSLATGPYWAY